MVGGPCGLEGEPGWFCYKKTLQKLKYFNFKCQLSERYFSFDMPSHKVSMKTRRNYQSQGCIQVIQSNNCSLECVSKILGFR